MSSRSAPPPPDDAAFPNAARPTAVPAESSAHSKDATPPEGAAEQAPGRYISPTGIECLAPPGGPNASPPQSPAEPTPAELSALAKFFDFTVPCWIPKGVDLQDMPADLQAAIAHVINPTYCELVLNARPGLQQSTGLTIAYLLWLEILDHLEMAAAGEDIIAKSLGKRSSAHVHLIDRHLRVVNAKLKASDMLLRLQQFKDKCRRDDRRPLTDRELEKRLLVE